MSDKSNSRLGVNVLCLLQRIGAVGLSAYIRLGGCRGFARARGTRARARPCVGLPPIASAGRKTIGTAGGSYRSHPWRKFNYEF